MVFCISFYYTMTILQVLKATLTSMHRGGMEGQLMDMVKFPLYFEYMDGEVGRIFAIENDSVFCTNIKKGILSLFQVQTEPGERTEVLFWMFIIFIEVYVLWTSAGTLRYANKPCFNSSLKHAMSPVLNKNVGPKRWLCANIHVHRITLVWIHMFISTGVWKVRQHFLTFCISSLCLQW